MEICKLITVTTRILWRGWAGQRHGKQPVQPPAPLFSSLIIHSLRPIKMPLNSPEDCLDPVYAFSSSDSLSKCFKCSPWKMPHPLLLRFVYNKIYMKPNSTFGRLIWECIVLDNQGLPFILPNHFSASGCASINSALKQSFSGPV